MNAASPDFMAAELPPRLRPAPSRRIWPWLLGGLMLMLLLAALAGTAALMTVGREALEGAVIHVNGQRWEARMLDIDALGLGVLGIVAALLLAGMTVMLALGAAAMGVGLALLAVLATLLVFLSPLWLVVLLLWLMLRRPRTARA
jgi:hypothetical protein